MTPPSNPKGVSGKFETLGDYQKFVVHAAQCHRDLVGALELLLDGMEMLRRNGVVAPNLQMVKVARAALAKAVQS